MTPAAAPPDGAQMRRALDLARRGWGQTAPNPLVGAVVVRDGEVVGEGYHARYGGPHAEVVALRAAGERARGADVYVTLEPCAHHGKTPPCVDALVAAGVARVFVALRDPNPLAAGGLDRLREAGIAVEVGLLENEAEALLAPFLFSHQRQDRPFITLKLALSAEGAVAPADGGRMWFTAAEARDDVHRQRAEADAILVGIHTVLADDPQLTVRGTLEPRVPPRRLVLDRYARLPLGSALVRTAREVPVTVLSERPDPARLARLSEAGVEVAMAPSLEQHLVRLRARGVRHLYVEGGATVAEAFLLGAWVDRLVIFRTPVALGPGAHLGMALPLPGAAGGGAWRVEEDRQLGPDRRITYRPAER